MICSRRRENAVDNRIVTALMAGYAQKQEQNEREENRRMEEIQTLHPDLAQWVRRRHEMIMQSVRSGLAGAVQDPDRQMAEYNQKIAALLQSKGYPADYLAPVCDCPLCRDTGYVYERSVRVPCACLKKAYQAALSESGTDIQGEQTFENFDETRFPDEPLPKTDVTQREYMRLIREKCRAYADGIPSSGRKNLLLHGGSGLGKTYLLNCIGNHARGKGVEVTYVTAYDLLMALKNAYFSRTGEDGAREYFDAPLLLIDDLGMEPLMEGVTVEQIYNLLNSRMLRGLYTAVSSNLSRTELEKKYTERVSSRLLDTRTGMAIPFLGKDIRLIREK